MPRAEFSPAIQSEESDISVNNCRHQPNWETAVKGRNVFSKETGGKKPSISISSESLPSLVA